MIDVVTLIGSPRKKGNTQHMVNLLFSHLPTDKVRNETLFLYNHNIKPCTDCRACKKGDLVCTVKDDMQLLYPKIDAADLIIIGTPIYWFGPSAPTKLLLDRFRPYYGNQKLKGKKGALLLPAGSGEGDCDLCIEMFSRSFRYLGVVMLGAATSKAYDIGDVAKDEKGLKSIEELGMKIMQSFSS